jgi:NAD(P)-dependent dehydrogenase (short-subunit alcohol dehydrogenase family)
MSERVQPERLVLIAGASGYVGGRLLKALEDAGQRVRCLARRPEFLRPRVAASTEVVQGDVLDAPSLHAAMEGVDTAYYLVHSMGSGRSFEEEDRRAATNFAQAARDAEVLLTPLFNSTGALDWLPHALIYNNISSIMDSHAVVPKEDLPGRWQAAGVLTAYVMAFISLAFGRFLTRDVT